MIPLYEDSYFTFRFADDRIIPRFHLEGIGAGRRVSVFKINAVTGERLDLLATAIVGEGGWVDLDEPIIVRAGDAFVAVPEAATRLHMKRNVAKGRQLLARLEEMPNIGPAVAADLRQLGITTPADLPGRDPYVLYDDLCRITGQRHDPCLLDTFIAAVWYMEGEPKKPWWKYTAERKREMARRSGES